MKEVPTGVKIIAVLNYIGAVFLLIAGIAFIFGAGAMASVLAVIPFLASIGASFFIVIAIIMIALAVLSFFIGRGLWKGQNWARIVSIVFAIIGVLSGLISLIQGSFGSIVSLIIEGVIGGYLLFSKDVKEAFA